MYNFSDTETAKWMIKHPNTTIVLFIVGLLFVGGLIGTIVTTNLMNEGVQYVFEEGSKTRLPVLYAGNYYEIKQLNETDIKQYLPFNVTDFQKNKT